MTDYVVTVTRQFGSMGRLIAFKLAQRLGIDCYDREIVEKTAMRMNLPVSTISEQEERSGQSLFDLMKYPLGTSGLEFQDRLFETQRGIILNLVRKGSCVVIGRCSDYILREHKNHIKIYIYAPFEARLQNCIETLKLTEEEALKTIREVDMAREIYHIRYAHYSPDDPRRYDIMINSDYLGIEGTIELLIQIIMRRISDQK